MIIKPDAVSRNLIGEIIRRVEKEGFRILEMKMTKLDRGEAAGFYAIHKGEPFYDGLLDFMTSGRIVPIVLERENAVDHLRRTIGATDPEKAAPGTIRRDFARNERENAVHASDSPENAAWEISFFFGDQQRNCRGQNENRLKGTF